MEQAITRAKVDPDLCRHMLVTPAISGIAWYGGRH